MSADPLEEMQEAEAKSTENEAQTHPNTSATTEPVDFQENQDPLSLHSSNGTAHDQLKIVDINAECARGNFKPYVYALEKGFLRNPMQADQAGYSVLHQAIAFGDLALVRVLIENYHQSPNFVAGTQQTPLMIALNYCHRPIIRYLCKYESSFNHLDNTRFCPILYSVKQVDWFSFFYLLSKGSGLEASDVNGCTLAHWAAFKNDSFMVQILTRFGVDLGQKDLMGMTPFERAHSSACFISMKTLLDLSLAKYQTANFLKNDKMSPNEPLDLLPDTKKLDECSNNNCGPWMKREIHMKLRRKAGISCKASKETLLSGQFFTENYEELCLKSKWVPFWALMSIVGALWLVFLIISQSSHDLFRLMFAHIVLLHYIVCAFFFVSKEVIETKPRSKKNQMQSALNQNDQGDIEMTAMIGTTGPSCKIYALLEQSSYYIPFKEYHAYLQRNRMANYFFETVIEKYEKGAWSDLLGMHKRSICPLCLIWKPQRTRHCKRMNVCVRNYHTFSKFYNKLVSSSNHHIYLLLSILQLVLLWIFTSLVEEMHQPKTWGLGKVELAIFLASQLSFLVLPAYLITMGLFYTTLARVLVEFYCIGKNLTYDELYNRVHYPYLYMKATDQRGLTYLKWSNPNDQGLAKNIMSYLRGMGSS